MTELDRIIAACEIAERAVKRRTAQKFNAEEEPIILQGLASVPSLLLSLIEKEQRHEAMGDTDRTGTAG